MKYLQIIIASLCCLWVTACGPEEPTSEPSLVVTTAITLLVENTAEFDELVPYLADLPMVSTITRPNETSYIYHPAWQLAYPTAKGPTDTIALYAPTKAKDGFVKNSLTYHQRKLREFQQQAFSFPEQPTVFVAAHAAAKWGFEQAKSKNHHTLVINFSEDEQLVGGSPDSILQYLLAYQMETKFPKPVQLVLAKADGPVIAASSAKHINDANAAHQCPYASQAQLPKSWAQLNRLRQVHPGCWRVLARLAEMRKKTSIDTRFVLLGEAVGYAIASGESGLLLADLRRLLPNHYSHFQEEAPRHVEALIIALKRKQPWIAQQPIYLTESNRRGMGRQVLVVADERLYENDYYKFGAKVTTNRVGEATLFLLLPGETEARTAPLRRGETLAFEFLRQGFPNIMTISDLGFQPSLHDLHFMIKEAAR